MKARGRHVQILITFLLWLRDSQTTPNNARYVTSTPGGGRCVMPPTKRQSIGQTPII